MVEKREIDGVPVYSIDLNWVETLTMAFVVRAGSSNERDSLAGVSHFLEHVAFRGSERLSMKQMKYTIESVGGTLNAFTGRTSTVYYCRVPNFKSEEAFEIMKELVFKPKISHEDVEIERKIIKEEYRMSQENPEDRLHNMALESVWPGPYGRPVIGRLETIERISAEDIRLYHESMYGVPRVSLVLIGDTKLKLRDLDVSKAAGDDPEEPIFSHDRGENHITMKDIKQVHFLLLKEGLGMEDSDYHKMLLLSTMLGSGMSSYLFEEIREKRGMVYDISSENFFLRKTGILGVYFSASPDGARKTLDEVVRVLRDFRVSEYLEYGRERYLGKLKMMVESPGGILGFVIDRLSLGLDPLDPKEIEKEVRSITLDEMEAFTESTLKGTWRVFAVSPEGFELDLRTVEI